MYKRKTIYALLTRKCNLSCPHCDVHNIVDDFDKEKFLSRLIQTEGKIILFGGEPTLYQDRLFDIVNECKKAGRKIGSISTNLMILNDQLLALFKEIGSVATSWNPNRFTPIQYDIWYKNCINLAITVNVKPTLMITLDNDLMEMGVDEFLKVVDNWDPNVFKKIKMEHLNCIDNTPEYFDRVDDFLCELYSKWRSDIYNDINGRIKNWWFDCTGVCTIEPNGNIIPKCPHDVNPTIPEECYSCERADVCRPCVLQHHCSFPKKFAQLVSDGGN